MLMGQDGNSSRGFEVAYEKENKAYSVRIFTPSTKADWLSAFAFIAGLANYLDVDVVDEEENVYKPDHITYDYLGDITFGVKSFKGQEKNIIFSVNRPVAIDTDTIEAMLSAEDVVQYFSEFMERQQYVDAYVANPKFYQKNKDNSIIGIFTFTKTVPTILSYEEKPFIEITRYNINYD